MTYTICEPCIDVKDKACVDECPVDCIYEGPRMLYIHPDECVDCAACEPVCPVVAIFYEDDVPAEWKQFTPINAEFFDESVTGLGLPGRRRAGRPGSEGSSRRGGMGDGLSRGPHRPADRSAGPGRTPRIRRHKRSPPGHVPPDPSVRR